MKFTFICEDDFSKSKTTVECQAETINHVLDNFQDFLRGSGFHINGYLDVVPNEDNEETFTDHYDLNDFDQGRDRFDFNIASFDEQEQITLCPVCKIDMNIMKNNNCYDKNCPVN